MCYRDFKLTELMLQKFTSKMYDDPSTICTSSIPHTADVNMVFMLSFLYVYTKHVLTILFSYMIMSIILFFDFVNYYILSVLCISYYNMLFSHITNNVLVNYCYK